MTMQRVTRIFLIGGLALAVTVGAVGVLHAQTYESLRLVATTIAPPDNLWSKAGARYAEAVKQRTNGKVVIDMSYSGALGNVRETIEALRFGTVHIVIQEVGQLDTYNKLAGIASYPYLIRDIDHFRKVMYDGDVGQQFHAEIEKLTGYKLIGAGFRGPREMASRREIKTPDDLKGLKLRVPGQKIFLSTWKTLGANPVPMATLEVYTALQQGIIDGCENPLEAHVRSKYYEAVPYVIMTSHVNAYYSFIFDGKAFSTFSPAVQKVLVEEGDKAMRWGTDETLNLIGQYKKQLQDKGAKFVYPDIKPFQAKLEPMKKEFPEFGAWIDKFQGVR